MSQSMCNLMAKLIRNTVYRCNGGRPGFHYHGIQHGYPCAHRHQNETNAHSCTVYGKVR